MKKILFFLIPLFSFLPVFAGNSISINLDKKEVEIGEPFTLSFEIKNDNNIDIESIDVQGIDDLTQLSQSKRSQIVMINGKTQVSIFIDLNLQAEKEGNFTLGPAKVTLGKTTVSSGTVKLKVTQSTVSSGTVQKNTIFSGSHKNLENQNAEEIFYDIEGPQVNILLNYWPIFLFIFIMFIGLFYYFLEKYLPKNGIELKKENVQKLSVQQLKEDKKLYFRNKIYELRKQSQDLERSKFFGQLGIIYREFLEYNGLEKASTMTLAQMQGKKHNRQIQSIIDNYQEVYLCEFKDIKDVNEKKLVSLEAFEKLL